MGASKDVVSIYIDTQKNPQAAKLIQQYRFRGVPAMFILSPTGETLVEGVGRTPDALIKAFKAGPKITWATSLDGAIATAKDEILPVVHITLKKDDAASEKLNNELTKGSTIPALAYDFVWFKEELEDIKEPGIDVIDPYTNNAEDISAKSSADSIANGLKSKSRELAKKYRASNKLVCSECKKVKSGKVGTCHDKEMLKVKTFRCEKCGKPSSTDGRCCGEERTAVTE